MLKNYFSFLISVLFFFSFISFAVSQIGSAEVNFFTTDGGNYICNKTIYDAYWQNVATGERVFIHSLTQNTSGVCYNTTYSNSWCCPTNYNCQSGTCVQTDLEYEGDFCTRLPKALCNISSSVFASSLMDSFSGKYAGVCGSDSFYVGFWNGAEVCANVTECACAWDNNLGKCTLAFSEQTICGSEVLSSKTCSWSENPDKKQNLCEVEGRLVVVYTASPEGISFSSGITCSDQEVSYPCSVSVQLPFFGGFSFLFSILGIIGIYFLYSKLNLVNKLSFL